jgi:hypothetical protein
MISSRNFKFSLFIVSLIYGTLLNAQGNIPLTDLSSFQMPGRSWSLASDVTGDLAKNEVLTTVNGTGVLINLPDKSHPGKDLYTNIQHGDADLELDYMMAKGSNSGIYLQGRYEIQLLDSWGVLNPKAGDNAGIYERWDTTKPKGEEGYEGYAPRQNVSRAPGLWQHIKISFQAPRFNSSGQKIQNAKILRVELNNVLIHEDVELSGPTRGAMADNEVAEGPLRLQGDHGAVAFRNIQLTKFDKPAPELVSLKYNVYKGKYEEEPDYKKLPPEAAGTSGILSSNVSTLANEFIIHYTGILKIKEPGEYNFNLNVPGGSGQLKLNNQTIISVSGRGGRTGKITLSAGDVPFDLYYSKFLDYAKPALGLSVAGPGIRETIISDNNVSGNDAVDPILIHAPVNTIMRSFVDLADDIRITHAVNVGSTQQLHYTYDMEKGMIVQAWRGDFLDASPMWHSRGDGSTRAMGMRQLFGKPVLAIEKLSAPQAAWIYDTTGSGYRPKGYVLDSHDRPIFKYIVYGTAVNDSITVSENGQELHRQVSLQSPGENLFFRVADAKDIEMISDGLYILDDKSYYIRLDDTSVKPLIRDANGRKEMIVPIQNKFSYSILF